MRAVVVAPDRSLQVVHKPEPEPGPGEVLIAVDRCGICGSDLHLHNSGFIPPGAVMGHEFSGTIVAIGPDTDTDTDSPLPTGTRVAVLPSARDHTCPRCEEGRTNLCGAQAMTSIGLGFNDGGYAEFAKAPAESCHALPDWVTPEEGALVEPYAVALHAVRRSRAFENPAQNVGVIGAGPVGLLTIAALKDAGVTDITVAERSEARAAAAERLGARVTDDAERLAKAAGQELDIVFDAAGVAATTPIALMATRPGGQIVLVGVVDVGVMLEMPGMLWVVKEVDVLPSIAYNDDEFAEAVLHFAGGAIDTGAILSDVRPLDAAEQSFKDLTGPAPPIKVQLAPGM